MKLRQAKKLVKYWWVQEKRNSGRMRSWLQASRTYNKWYRKGMRHAANCLERKNRCCEKAACL